MKILLSSLCLWMTVLLVCSPFSASAVGASTIGKKQQKNEQKQVKEPVQEKEKIDPELPVWSEDEQKAMLNGTIWEDMPDLLPSNVKVEHNEPAVVTPSFTEEKGVVEPFPENFQKVHEKFLPEYIRPLEAGLIDPQRLLNEVERQDVLMLIAKIRKETGGYIYVSLFAPGQVVPPEINAPALARQIFKKGQRSLLLHIHYGDVKATQIACDPEMTAKLEDNGRRLLVSKVKERSSLFTDPQDCLIESIYALVELASPEMRALFLEEKQKMTPQSVGVPEVNVTFTEKEEIQEKHFTEKINEMFAQYQGYAYIAMYGGVALALLLGFYLWSRNCRPVHLLRTESDKRLGAVNGAGISRSVNYGFREDSSPDSVARKQMRDHMRDNY